MAEHESEHPPVLDPEEPITPFWFTLLGGALFLLGALLLIALGDEEPGVVADPGAPPDQGAALED